MPVAVIQEKQAVYFDYLALYKTVNVNILQDRNSNQKFKKRIITLS